MVDNYIDYDDNNIDYDTSKYSIDWNSDSYITDFTKKSKIDDKIDISDLIVNVFDIIKNCQTEMIVPIFDKNDFGYSCIQEYIQKLNS
jgi:hypothetical protein